MRITVILVPSRGIHQLIQLDKKFGPIASQRLYQRQAIHQQSPLHQQHSQSQQQRQKQLRQFAAGSSNNSSDSTSSAAPDSSTSDSSTIKTPTSRGILESFLDLSSSVLSPLSSSSSTREQRRMRRDQLRQIVVKKRKAAKEAAAATEAGSSKDGDATTTTTTSSEQEQQKIRPPFWYYLSIFPDPHGYDPNYKDPDAIKWPKDWATFKLIFDESVKEYKTTWDGFFESSGSRNEKSNAEKKDNNDKDDDNSSTQLSQAIQSKRKEIKSNISKNTKFIKKEATKAFQVLQEKTDIYTLQDLKAWASRQMILATECLRAFTEGYRQGRDDEVHKMANLYFADFFQEAYKETKKSTTNVDDNETTKEKRIRTGRTKTIMMDDGTKIITRRKPKQRARTTD